MKKSLFVLAAILLVALLGMGTVTRTVFVSPEYAKKFTGYRSLTGTDTIVGTAVDTILINIHTCFEDYYAPNDTTTSITRTVWCLAVYANEAANDSVDWDLDLSLSYDSIHWNYRGNIGPYALSADSLLLIGITKDADLMEWLRIIRTGGGDNDASAGSIGEILLIWQLRGPKISGNTVGLQD